MPDGHSDDLRGFNGATAWPNRIPGVGHATARRIPRDYAILPRILFGGVSGQHGLEVATAANDSELARILLHVARVIAELRGLPSAPVAICSDDLLSAFLEEICLHHELSPWDSVGFDGVSDGLRFLTASKSTLRFCGCFHVLALGDVPSVVPASLQITLEPSRLRYRLSLDCGNSNWQALTAEKQWGQVYLMCRGELALPWTWAYEVEGSFELDELR